MTSDPYAAGYTFARSAFTGTHPGAKGRTYDIIASEASFLVCSMARIFSIFYIILYIYILDRCRASRERSELDLSDRMAFWAAQLNAALRCMANSITVLWLS